MSAPNIAPPWLIRVHHRLRSASFATVMLAVSLHMRDKDYGWPSWLFMVLVFLVYPQLLYWRSLRSEHAVAKELRNLLLDAMLLGLAMAMLGFPLWLTVAVTIAALVNSATNTGWPGVGKTLLAAAAGMAFGYLATGMRFEPATNWQVTATCILGLAIYLVVVGNVGFVRNSQLRQTREDLRQRKADLLSANQRLQVQLTEIAALQQQLREQAMRDPLTGLHNRRFLDSVLEREAARCLREEQPLALLMVDVDYFKRYNDRYGHQAGDQCLRAVAGCLQAAAKRATDLAARYGGEEFCIVLIDANLDMARRLAEALRHAVADLGMAHEDSPLGRVTISVGVAVMRGDGGCRADDLLRAADEALYCAKQNGRDRVEVDAVSAVEDDRVAMGGLVKLVWHASYECGRAETDDQHRLLFGLANRLLSAIVSGAGADVVTDHADALLAYVGEHFREEEALMVKHGYPELAEHVAIHQQLSVRATELAACCRAGHCEVGDMFEYLAQELVFRHILGADRKLAAYLAECQPPAA